MWHHTAGEFETCDQCRFDGAAYTNDDVTGTLRALAGWAGSSIAGIDAVTLNRRPAPTVWSPAEYLRHTKRVLWSMAGLAELAVDAGDHAVDGEPPDDANPADPSTDIDPVREVVRLHEEATRLGRMWSGADAPTRAMAVRVNGRPADLAGIVRHAIHDATHHLSDIGRGIVALGVGSSPATGHVARIGASHGGVPKPEVAEVRVGYRGVEGDRQATRRHHGRVWQALCVWSTEVIDDLAAEGHPVSPGSAGENFTISGLDWSMLRPGARLRFGGDDGVVAECTAWAEPCRTLVESFMERDFRRIDDTRHPGSSRIYAKVLVDGIVRAGDPVTVC